MYILFSLKIYRLLNYMCFIVFLYVVDVYIFRDISMHFNKFFDISRHFPGHVLRSPGSSILAVFRRVANDGIF